MKLRITMRNLLTAMFAVVFVLGSVGQTDAQIAAWNFQGNAGNEATVNATISNDNLTTPVVSRGSGISAAALANSYHSNNFTLNGDRSNAITNNDFVQLTVQAESGFTVSLSTLDARFRRSGAGPNTFQWQYSLDGFATAGVDISSEFSYTGTATAGQDQTQIDLSGITALQEVENGTTITIRLFGWGSTTTGGTFSLGRNASGNDLAIGGTVDVVAGAVVPPTDFTATTVSSTQINLSWNQNDATDDVLLAVNSADTFGEPTGTYTIGNSITGGGTVIAAGNSTSFNHTTLDPNTEYFYSIWSKNGTNEYSPAISSSATTAKVEPSNHVTNAEMLSGRNSIIVKWDDATGGVIPDGYLVEVSSTGFGSITEPADGTEPLDDLDLSDGSASVKVDHGTGFISFVGLTQGQTYYAKIFPYTNEGTLIDFKTDGSVPEVVTTVQSYISVFRESFSTSSITVFNSYTSSDNAGFAFEGVGDVRTSLASSGYTNASGDGNAFFTNQPRELVISGINTTGLENLSIQFGMNSPASVGLTVEVSDDGVDYTVLPYNPRPEGGWNLEMIPGALLPQGENIRLKFTNNSNTIRLDDLELLQAGSQLTIPTSAGYRLMSAPGASTYANIFSNVWLQGMSGITGNGSPLESQPSNILTYNESSRTFEQVKNASTTPAAGTGFLYYHFNDDNYDDTDNTTASIVSVSAVEHSAPTLNLSYTEEGDAADRGWHLLGNPFASSINAHSITGNANINGVIYVYDHSYGTATGEDVANPGTAGGAYRVWNGAGSLSGGRVAPFQAFWVQLTGAVSDLELGTDLKSTEAATFYKDRSNNGVIQLFATSEFGISEAWITIDEEASIGLDSRDAYKLVPLDLRPYLNLATQIGDNLFDMNNIPSSLTEVVEIPLHVDLKDVSDNSWVSTAGEVNLSWPSIENLPSGWVLELIDSETGTVVNMLENESYSLQLSASMQKAVNEKPSQTPTVQKSGDDSRLILRVGPGVPTSTEFESNLPAALALSQNYPNPFNPTTTMSYDLPAESQVSLSVYDLLGRQVAVLVNNRVAPGTHNVNFDGSSLSSGIYVIRLEADGQVMTRKMTLLK